MNFARLKDIYWHYSSLKKYIYGNTSVPSFSFGDAGFPYVPFPGTSSLPREELLKKTTILPRDKEEESLNGGVKLRGTWESGFSAFPNSGGETLLTYLHS